MLPSGKSSKLVVKCLVPFELSFVLKAKRRLI